MPFNQAIFQQILDDLSDTDIPRRGLSLSGGDPLHPNNVPVVLELVKRVRQECPGKDIWCWTGYEIEQLSELQWQLVKLIDVLIDGRFEQDKLSAQLPWRGSSNQRIIYIDEWLKKEEHS
jgi:anaerobic ribonucleoside-triphosphate reductase activating protein